MADYDRLLVIARDAEHKAMQALESLAEEYDNRENPYVE